jgi:hypothetical protein
MDIPAEGVNGVLDEDGLSLAWARACVAGARDWDMFLIYLFIYLF